jgi:hypothetical protein
LVKQKDVAPDATNSDLEQNSRELGQRDKIAEHFS